MKRNKPIHKKMWLKKYKTKLKEKKYLGQESNMDHLKEKSTPSLLCTLCTKRFCSEQRKTQGTGFSGHVRNEQEPNTGNWGRGRGRKEKFADKPLDFENLHSPVNIHVATDWLG